MHVAAAAPPAADRVELRLRRTGHPVQNVSDPYRALARLVCGRSEGRSVPSIVACVDFFTPEEFEFFEIVRRDHPDVHVYVYGDARCEDKIRRAERLGAFRLADDAGLVAPIHPADPTDSIDPTDPVAPIDAAAHAPVVAIADQSAASPPTIVSTARVVRQDANDMPPDDGGSAAPHERSSGAAGVSVRVPWRHYGDAPKRRPPARRGRSAKPAAAPSLRPSPPTLPAPAPRAAFAPAFQNEPLLTEEEFEALTADDDALDDRDGPDLGPEGGRAR